MVFDSKEYYLKNKDKIKANSKTNRQTYNGKRSLRITTWKSGGIIIDDFKHYYDTVYFPATHCEICNVEFCIEARKSTSKNLDHDHKITDRPNVRNIVCSACNRLSNRQEIYKTNTSGYANIRKIGNTFQVRIEIRGKTTSKTFKTISEAIEFRNNIKNNI